jgi:cell division septation protein DedD
MKIDKDKLVDLLVEKTSMEKNEVEDQLEQLIDRIVDAAYRGKALEIKEFGVFYFDENGDLKFDPSNELSTEISFKYAGMTPVELKPERDTAIPLGTEDAEDFTREPEPVEDFSETPETTDDTDDVFGLDDSDDDDFDFLSEPVEESKSDMDIWDEVARQEEEERKLEEEKKQKAAAKLKAMKPARKKSNAGIWVIAAIFLLLILVGIYIYFIDSHVFSGTPQTETTAEQQATLPEELPAITDEDAEAVQMEQIEIEAEQETAEEVTVTDEIEPEPMIPAVDEQATFGLMGSINEEATNGYSIVIHSFNSEENARTAAAQLSEDGYRVLVSSRSVGGESMWRVSVGQFSSFAEAQENTTRLPPPYNQQNFIHRIQNN